MSKNAKIIVIGAVVALLAGMVLGIMSQKQATAYNSGLRTDTYTIVTPEGKRHDFTLEIADTPETQQIGLMHRTAMAEDHGMFFDFGKPAKPTWFWMKNTLIPLDMLFIAEDGKIIHIARNTTPQSLDRVSSGGPVVAVIELNGGMSARLGIAPGAWVDHPYFGE